MKEQELIDEVNQLLKDIGQFEDGEEEPAPHVRPRDGLPTQDHEGPRRPKFRRESMSSYHSTDDGIEDSDDEGDESTALTQKRRPGLRRKTVPNIMAASTDMTASTEVTRSLRRYSTTYDDYAEQAAAFSSGIMLKKRIISLYVQLCELKSYVQLNKTGFSKVLKKFDKIIDRRMRQSYMESVVEPAYPFRPETMKTIEDNVEKMVKAYTRIVTDGDEEAARRDLRSHLREHVVWERNTVWRDLIGLERRAEAASLGHTLLGGDIDPAKHLLQGDDEVLPSTKQIRTPFGRCTCPAWLVSTAFCNLVLITALFFILLFVPIMEKAEEQNCLAMLVFVSLLWATEV